MSEVERTARALHVDAKAALDLLIDEALLEKESERRGLQREGLVASKSAQAAVQALLDGEIEKTSIGPDEIEAAYAAQHDRFHVPERRASLHVLVVVKRSEAATRQAQARALSERIRNELMATNDTREVWARYRAQSNVEGFAIKAEEIGPVSTADPFAPEYLEGLFSRAEIGVVERVYQTDFGWHAIVITDISPAQVTSLEDARALLRDELQRSARKEALDRLLADLASRHRVRPDPTVIDAFFQGLDATGNAPP